MANRSTHTNVIGEERELLQGDPNKATATTTMSVEAEKVF